VISLRDCIEYLQLSPEEVDAIAEHQHVSPIIAAELASYLVESDDGERMIKRMILDDLLHARACGDAARADQLRAVLEHFIASHPQRP
jgi:hypothetical protein